jgi:hypothetical protein
MRLARSASRAFTLLLLGGCAGNRAFICPDRGGPARREVTSDHIVPRRTSPNRGGRGLRPILGGEVEVAVLRPVCQHAEQVAQ